MSVVSIVLPVRYESPYAVEAFDSLKENTVSFDDVEVLVGYDERDENMPEIINSYAPLLKGIPIDMRMTIHGLGMYTNQLVANSVGRIVWWTADDIIIKTKGYDQVLKHIAILYGDQVYYFHPTSENAGGAFPILTRKWLDTTGHWSGHSRIDSWNNVICDHLPNERVRIPVYGFEIENTVVSGKNKQLHAPPLPKEFEGHFHTLPFERQEVQDLIQKDIDALRREIKNGS